MGSNKLKTNNPMPTISNPQRSISAEFVTIFRRPCSEWSSRSHRRAESANCKVAIGVSKLSVIRMRSYCPTCSFVK